MKTIYLLASSTDPSPVLHSRFLLSFYPNTGIKQRLKPCKYLDNISFLEGENKLILDIINGKQGIPLKPIPSPLDTETLGYPPSHAGTTREQWNEFIASSQPYQHYINKIPQSKDIATLNECRTKLHGLYTAYKSLIMTVTSDLILKQWTAQELLFSKSRWIYIQKIKGPTTAGSEKNFAVMGGQFLIAAASRHLFHTFRRAAGIKGGFLPYCTPNGWYTNIQFYKKGEEFVNRVWSFLKHFRPYVTTFEKTDEFLAKPSVCKEIDIDPIIMPMTRDKLRVFCKVPKNCKEITITSLKDPKKAKYLELVGNHSVIRHFNSHVIINFKHRFSSEHFGEKIGPKYFRVSQSAPLLTNRIVCAKASFKTPQIANVLDTLGLPPPITITKTPQKIDINNYMDTAFLYLTASHCEMGYIFSTRKGPVALIHSRRGAKAWGLINSVFPELHQIIPIYRQELQPSFEGSCGPQASMRAKSATDIGKNPQLTEQEATDVMKNRCDIIDIKSSSCLFLNKENMINEKDWIKILNIFVDMHIPPSKDTILEITSLYSHKTPARFSKVNQ